MGFSTILAWVGVFLVLIVALSSLMSVYNSHLGSMSDFYEYEKKAGERFRTDYSLASTSYISGVLELHVKNTGRTRIQTTDGLGEKCMDFFIDGAWISQSDYSTELMNKTWSPLQWDPEEYMNISINTTPSAGSHVLTIVDCTGIKKTSQIFI